MLIEVEERFLFVYLRFDFYDGDHFREKRNVGPKGKIWTFYFYNYF